MSDINLRISTLSTYHESLLSNKQGGIFGSLLVGEPMSTPLSLEEYTMSVLESIECAGKECLPSVEGSKGGHRGRKVAIAGWSEHCKPYQDECKFWHSMWQSLGKPSVGQVYWTMRHTRNQYKYAIRRLKRSQYKIQNDKFVSSLINRGVNIFQEIRKYRGKSCTISSRIDDEVGAQNIANHFATIYSHLYNKVELSEKLVALGDGFEDRVGPHSHAQVDRVTEQLVGEAIRLGIECPFHQ